MTIELDAAGKGKKREMRGEAGRKIIESLEKSPATPKELSAKLNLPISTVNHNLRHVLRNLGIIKQLKSGKYALKWYSTEEESIKNAHEFIKERLLRSPTPEEIAYRIKESPGKARELLFKYIPGYSEPTVEEIEEAANRVWDLMFWGDVLSQIQIDESIYDINIIHINCRAWIDKVEEFEDREQLVLESKSYLERYPEMKPEIVSWIDDDTQFFEAKWADEVLAYISKFSVYKTSFYTL